MFPVPLNSSKITSSIFEPEEEYKAVAAIKKAFPNARVDLDPNGCWSLEKSLEMAPKFKEILASGGQIDNTIIALKNGMLVEGFLVHERVDKVNDTEGV